MSAWKMVTRNLYAKGGGPLPLSAFVAHYHNTAIDRARSLGLIAHAGAGNGWRLTQAGIDYCEGRAELVIPYAYTPRGRARGTCMRLVATWLKALPRAGEIRLGVM